MINTKTNEFITQLANLVNNAELPVCNVRLALNFVLTQVMEIERAAIQQEMEQAVSKEHNEDTSTKS